MKKRVGLDCHVLDGKHQGSRTHVLQIISRLIPMARDIDFYLFLENIETVYDMLGLSERFNVHPIKVPHANPLARLCWVLPRLQRKYHLDLFHSQYITPLPSQCPTIVTIHDILFESFPQYFTRFFILRSKVMVRLSANLSEHVLTVSRFAKHELEQKYKLQPGKITVTHNAVDTQTFCPGDAGKEFVKNRGLVPGEYILSVGRLEPRKNHATMIRAYAKLPRSRLPLVIIGERYFGYDEVFDLVQKLKVEKDIIIIEDISDEVLPAFYRHARLFVYPSWAEGFGIPPLEAMASGIPVICSNTTAMPDVVGRAARLVYPGDSDGLALAMRTILEDSRLQVTMRKDSLMQAQCFTWEEAALKTLQAYQGVLDSHKGFTYRGC